MTLVVARGIGERIAIVSDTLVTQQEEALPPAQGVIKSWLYRGICVSFSNSPELAARDFLRYVEKYPLGVGYAQTVTFFEESSRQTENDYIVAFAHPAKLVKIVDGKRINSLATTQWIGDQQAYERFREYEAKRRKGIEAGRAINAVLFTSEMERSPASDLYSTMRHVIADTSISSAGGFACVMSNEPQGFRPSVYSDMLYDWPKDEPEDFVLQLHHKIDFGASGENAGYAVAQMSPGFLGMNLVAFYFVKGKTLFIFRGGHPLGLANQCAVINDLEPTDIAQRLTQVLGVDLNWRLIITSAGPTATTSGPRPPGATEDKYGVSFPFYTHANTHPKPKGSEA